MRRRLNATALAERRYQVAKMNREGMTLAEIGEKLNGNASTVCRDMAWVREEWRKSVAEDYGPRPGGRTGETELRGEVLLGRLKGPRASQRHGSKCAACRTVG